MQNSVAHAILCCLLEDCDKSELVCDPESAFVSPSEPELPLKEDKAVLVGVICRPSVPECFKGGQQGIVSLSTTSQSTESIP